MPGTFGDIKRSKMWSVIREVPTPWEGLYVGQYLVFQQHRPVINGLKFQ